MLNLKAIIAIGVFAIAAISLTELSIYQLVATKKADQKIAISLVVDSTFEELTARADTLQPGESTLADTEIDGKTYSRSLQISESPSGVTRIVILTIRERGKGRLPDQVYRMEIAKR